VDTALWTGPWSLDLWTPELGPNILTHISHLRAIQPFHFWTHSTLGCPKQIARPARTHADSNVYHVNPKKNSSRSYLATTWKPCEGQNRWRLPDPSRVPNPLQPVADNPTSNLIPATVNMKMSRVEETAAFFCSLSFSPSQRPSAPSPLPTGISSSSVPNSQ